MPNKKGGKKFKRGKKNREDGATKRTMVFAEDDQEYALVISKEGGSRLKVECMDGKIRSGIIRGKFRKRIWMNSKDILLVSVNATGKDSECYIEYKYDKRQIDILRRKKLIDFNEEDEEDENDGYEFKNPTDSSLQCDINNSININNVDDADDIDDADSIDNIDSIDDMYSNSLNSSSSYDINDL